MPRIARRAALFGFVATAVGAAAAWRSSASGGLSALLGKHRVDGSKHVLTTTVSNDEPIPGGGNWQVDGVETRATTDSSLQIAAYASSTSVGLGESIEFHVSMGKPGPFWVEVYRMGFYGGLGARRMAVSHRMQGVKQPMPKADAPLGTVACGWAPSWRLDIATSWVSGYYLAVFTSASGYRSYTPFVVRDDQRQADLCVVLPFTTYQAYNLWPKNGKLGRSLYYGYKMVVPTPSQPATRALDYTRRAFEVSFDRPYANSGLPQNYDLDLAFISWAEKAGYNMVFATSHDLHDGRVEPHKYKGLVFSGHDEYWSREMRDNASAASAAGTSLVFLSANNVYWRVRMPDRADTQPGRLVTCYKGEGIEPVDASVRTARWREPLCSDEPEQSLLGVQFNGILNDPVPLVVREANHWFWAGTGVRNGDKIPDVVGHEADGLFADLPASPLGSQVLLSASPYIDTYTKAKTQNTSLIETDRGGLIFAAASLSWPRSLLPEGDRRIQIATGNLIDRVVGRKPSTAP